MCFGGGKAAQQAAMEAAVAKAQQQAEEENRQERVRQGQAGIDLAFSQYGPEYYDKYKTDYVAAQTPQVEDQYARAKDKAIAALAGRGILKSSIAGNTFADIEKTRADALGDVANQASDATNALRTSTEKAKTDLYSLNTSSTDPSAIAARAIGEASAFAAPPTTSRMGELFGSVLAPLVSYARADAYSPYGGRIRSFFNSPTTGAGSGRVIA